METSIRERKDTKERRTKDEQDPRKNSEGSGGINKMFQQTKTFLKTKPRSPKDKVKRPSDQTKDNEPETEPETTESSTSGVSQSTTSLKKSQSDSELGSSHIESPASSVRIPIPETPKTRTSVTEIIAACTSASAVTTVLIHWREFLWAYRLVTTPTILLPALIQRYVDVMKLELEEKIKLMICHRVVAHLKIWIKDFWVDFEDNFRLQRLILLFLQRVRLAKKDKLPQLGDMLFLDVKRKVVESKAKTHVVSEPYSFSSVRGIDVTTINSQSLAENLTVIDWKMWEKIHPWDYYEVKIVMDCPYVKHHQYVGAWVITSLCTPISLSQHLKRTLHWIEVAHLLYRMGNLNTCTAITYSVYRFLGQYRALKKAVEGEERGLLYEELVILVNPANNFKSLRAELKLRQNATCLPPAPLITKDATAFAEKAKLDKGDGEIDVSQLRIVSQQIQYLASWGSLRHAYTDIDEEMSFHLSNQPVLPQSVQNKLIQDIASKNIQELCAAVKVSDVITVRFLLSVMPIDDINGRNDRSQTPIYCAAMDGNIHLVADLLAIPGIDANAREHLKGNTAMHIAAINDHPEVIALLLQNAVPQIENNSGQFPKDIRSGKMNEFWTLHEKEGVKFIVDKYLKNGEAKATPSKVPITKGLRNRSSKKNLQVEPATKVIPIPITKEPEKRIPIRRSLSDSQLRASRSVPPMPNTATNRRRKNAMATFQDLENTYIQNLKSSLDEANLDRDSIPKTARPEKWEWTERSQKYNERFKSISVSEDRVEFLQAATNPLISPRTDTKVTSVRNRRSSSVPRKRAEARNLVIGQDKSPSQLPKNSEIV